MAIQIMEGFEWIAAGTNYEVIDDFLVEAERVNFADMKNNSTKAEIEAAPGPNQALAFGSGSDQVRYEIEGLPNEITIAFRVKWVFMTSSTTALINIIGPSGSHVLLLQRGQTLFLQRASSFTAFTINPEDWYLNEWNHVELYTKIDNATGAYELRLNGTNVASDTNVDTRFFSAGITRVDFTNASTTSTQTGFWLTDIVIFDETGSDLVAGVDWLGEQYHVYQTLPTGDTTPEDWGLSVGLDSFALIDEINHDDNTSYIESSTTAQKTRCTYANTGAETGIIGVSINTTAALDTGTTAETYRSLIHEGTTETAGATITIDASATWKQSTDLYETNPDTGLPWTAAEIDGISGGVEYV